MFSRPFTGLSSLVLCWRQGFSFAHDTSLALRYPAHVFIKFWWLCACHVGWRDGNPTVDISPVFMGAKNRAVTLIGGINTHSN